ncbi:hypothetical protein A2814_00945 [Candidatus Nomurabacteria bacterium RIFCSPHIGHO2_01_FULL_38_19]|uniref:Baseplate protein J-like domain-containing protein n=1 Tax=Candidatus Nomurabacteria bacterium RIFCSPHIGHO2_01_FULL_38_19 TaxID=1801732 RepID=A0A1F6URW0_9BACT|nr:MAG: hypothetical protein A2814_00945 [Candidatus Nomurabacteria bacterium RIFCSPHIGHO2_01_FULL_38_19]
MPKNLFQDMVKIKNAGKDTGKYIKPKEKQEEQQKEVKAQNEKGHKYGLWFVAFISIVFFLFALSFLFARAKVTVSPKIKDITLDENLSAVKDSNVDGLSFDLVVLSGKESKSVFATEEKEISLKGEGTVLIYNAFSSASQRLLIDTRLEGSNGKIYKTKTAVTVPGMSADGAPGQVEANIYGAEAGEEYNSPPLDFKIFGFKGTPKYSKFYARSKGAITGGFQGKSPIVSETEKENTLAGLKTTLKEKLFKKASDQIPSGFILFKDAVFLNIDEESTIPVSESRDLPIIIKGTMYGLLFNEENLTKKIAQDNISNYDESDVYIPNIGNLIFSLSNQDISFADVQNISFNLSGATKVVWKFDEAKLSADLLGKSKKDFGQILAQYSNVESAQLTLSPFWIRSFPDKIKDIKVIVNYPK